MDKKKTVLCVGCNVIDFITISNQFPEEDTDRRCLCGRWQRGGNASNNCTVLKNLGVSVEFFGMLSSSAAFRILLDDMRKRGIKFENCPQTEKDPPFSSVILAKETGTRTIVHCNMDFPYVSADDFRRIDLQNYGWAHFEARFTNETLLMMQAIQDFNKDREACERIVISLDLESRFDECFVLCHMCDYVILSKDVALEQNWKTAEAACKSLRDKLKAYAGINGKQPYIICPWGSDGAGCLDPKDTFQQLPAYSPTCVVDTLGAGDTFMAAFIFATYIRESNFSAAVDFANRAAGYKIAHQGYDDIANVLTETT